MGYICLRENEDFARTEEVQDYSLVTNKSNACCYLYSYRYIANRAPWDQSTWSLTLQAKRADKQFC